MGDLQKVEDVFHDDIFRVIAVQRSGTEKNILPHRKMWKSARLLWRVTDASVAGRKIQSSLGGVEGSVIDRDLARRRCRRKRDGVEQSRLA